MDIGYFQEFGRSGTVLLSGDSLEIIELSNALTEFVLLGNDYLKIDELSFIAVHRDTELSAIRDFSAKPSQFNFLCTKSDILQITERLAALAESESGHQYFELIETDIELVVSVGEYPQAWWNKYGLKSSVRKQRMIADAQTNDCFCTFRHS